MKLSEVGEFGLIARWRQKLARRGGVQLGIGDDAAILDALATPVVTCDALIEDVHFRRDWIAPRQLGRKAITVNVSDMAAMGAQPVAAFIMLGLSARDDFHFVEELYAGLEDAAAAYDLTIAGGDTVRAPHALTLGVTVIGDAARPIRRSGAQAGDVLLVTGTPGDAAAGLHALQHPEIALPAALREALIARHHAPVARLREMDAALTIAQGVTAAIDISDGLAGDAAHIAAQSGVAIEIDVAAIPLSTACRAAAPALGGEAPVWALSGGEDYELLLCVRAAAVEAVRAAIVEATGTPVTAIGRCVAPNETHNEAHGKTRAEPVTLLFPDGSRQPAPRAFTHF